MNPSTRAYASAIVLHLLVCTSFVFARGGGYSIPWHSIGAGGGSATASSWALAGAIGQSNTGEPMQAGSWTVRGGFAIEPQCLFGFTGGCCNPDPACPADINGDQHVDVADLVHVILEWGCSEASTSTCTANVSGADCAVDVQDLVEVILQWGDCD